VQCLERTAEHCLYTVLPTLKFELLRDRNLERIGELLMIDYLEFARN
jgi:hypothetical protein